MKHVMIASALALISATAVNAQSTAKPGGAMKLSQAECDTLWGQANPGNAATISQSQAQPYVTDFKRANPDNDGSLDKAEFTKACGMGLVKSGGSSSGTSSGSSGAGDSSSGSSSSGGSRY